jgi:cobaltochelatase CobS
MTTADTTSDTRIICKIDNALCHSIKNHISKNHAGVWTVARYSAEFPGEPLLSQTAMDAVRLSRAEKAAEVAVASVPRKSMAELFGMPADKLKNPRGEQIMLRYFEPSNFTAEERVYLPELDAKYVFPIELTKSVILGFELNIPVYLWGLHGSGKSTLPEQAACRTGRAFMRVQHTVNTEESHILGQMVVESNAAGAAVTRFALGPLPMAMLMGAVYCADEYDFALPHVTAVYQPVLEGKSLIIKEAPLEWRVIKPHPNFRFVGTGNTNGGGDDTGLYQGTQIMNAANFSRFGITEQVDYPEAKVEAAIVAGQANIRLDDAKKLVSFATEVRKAFVGRLISSTVSPRELINAGRLGMVRGSDWSGGLMMAFANRLSTVDREVVKAFAQRIFG